MADTSYLKSGHPIKLIDQGDGTYAVASSMGGGTSVVGKVGIDQTTDGTTNKVQARNATHGNFQVNATMQINDTDVSASVPVPVEGNAKSVYATTAVAASGVIKNAAGTLYGLVGINNKASAQYIQIHNATAVPADTAVPLVVITVPATSNFSIDFGIFGLACATGICWSNSSTLATKTIGAADCWATANYK